MRALIVDEARAIRRLLRMYLENAGLEEADIHEATSGEEALRMQKDLQPQVMFLDMELPDMGGDEVLEKALEQDLEVKVVIVTAYPRSEPRVTHAISQGAFETLQKPVHQDDLTSMINQIRRERPGAGTIA